MMSQAGFKYDQHQLRVRSNSWDKTRVENDNIKSDKCNFIITRVRTLHTEGGVVKFSVQQSPMFWASGGAFYTHGKLQRSEKRHNTSQMLFIQGRNKFLFQAINLVNLSEKLRKLFGAPLYM